MTRNARFSLTLTGRAPQRMLSTIDEIQAMITLARGEATDEETRTVELNALLESRCGALTDLGQPVEYMEGKKPSIGAGSTGCAGLGVKRCDEVGNQSLSDLRQQLTIECHDNVPMLEHRCERTNIDREIVMQPGK